MYTKRDAYELNTSLAPSKTIIHLYFKRNNLYILYRATSNIFLLSSSYNTINGSLLDFIMGYVTLCFCFKAKLHFFSIFFYSYLLKVH